LNPAENILKLPELRRRILFTFFMLAIFRLGAHIPVPGINAVALEEFFERASGTIFGFFDLFSGGAFSRLTIFALGVMPYISASIIMDLLSVVIPKLAQLKKEGERGRAEIISYARYGTVFISAIQSLGLALSIEALRSPSGMSIVINPGPMFVFTTVVTMVAGTMLLMWIGEQINERGIGNGISLIIFAGIVARIPSGFTTMLNLIRTGDISLLQTLVIVFTMISVIAFIVYMELAHRKITINYPKRMIRGKLYGGQSSFLPIKLNISGVIPPIFASSLLAFPVTVARFADTPFSKTILHYFSFESPLYLTIYAILIIFFAFFYTSIIFNPQDIAENLRKYGGFVPGIRPGQKTAEYIDRIVARLTLVGSLYLAFICVMPSIFINYFRVPIYFGGTSLLIVVGVAMDMMRQLESFIIMSQYEGLLKKHRF